MRPCARFTLTSSRPRARSDGVPGSGAAFGVGAGVAGARGVQVMTSSRWPDTLSVARFSAFGCSMMRRSCFSMWGESTGIGMISASPRNSGCSRPVRSSKTSTMSRARQSMPARACSTLSMSCCRDSASSLRSSFQADQTSLKFIEITLMGMARTRIPTIMVQAATTRPRAVTGYSSPYPTVVNVTMHHQKQWGMLTKGVKLLSPLTLIRTYRCSSGSQ
mmetsp:Transcript_85346/g.241906  ORF Transcript_85346/g.241906 Transcript_85346/m.241906 type:complete len:219 (+) Transcript_85346:764-1420(+)